MRCGAVNGTNLLIARPHHTAVRKQVLAVLARGGVLVTPHHIVPAGSSDEMVIAAMREHQPSALLSPLHPHRDTHGQLVDGLALVQRLFSEGLLAASMPVFMPATAMGLSTFELALARDADRGGLCARLRNQIVPLPLATLDAPEVLTRIREAVARARETV